MTEVVKSMDCSDQFSVRKHTVRVLTPQEVDIVGGGKVSTWVYGTVVLTATIACTIAASMDGTEAGTVTVETAAAA